jgi:hypothetical protein
MSRKQKNWENINNVLCRVKILAAEYYLYTTGFLPTVDQKNLELAFPFRYRFCHGTLHFSLKTQALNYPRDRMPNYHPRHRSPTPTSWEMIAKSRKPAHFGQKWADHQKPVHKFLRL